MSLAAAPPRPPGSIIFVRYVLFAVVATLANLAGQEIVYQLAPVARLPLAILAGTAIGFTVKYVLDKRWIFYDATTSRAGELRKVGLYGAFSVFTTLIFWGFEIAFWLIWRTATAKYTGAVIGLAIGYALKYGLDRTYVFTERRL